MGEIDKNSVYGLFCFSSVVLGRLEQLYTLKVPVEVFKCVTFELYANLYSVFLCVFHHRDLYRYSLKDNNDI